MIRARQVNGLRGTNTEYPDMDHLGLALIVGGAAYLVSGLVFLLPRPRKR